MEEIFSKQIKEVSVTQTWLTEGTLTSLILAASAMPQETAVKKVLGACQG